MMMINDLEAAAMRRRARLVGLLGALLLVVLFNVLPMPRMLSLCLVDRGDEVNVFAVQHVMWLALGLGMAELFVRFSVTQSQESELGLHLLPEDDLTLLTMKDMPDLFARARGSRFGGDLSSLMCSLAAQYQNSKSVEMCNEMLNSYADLRLHEVELRYNVLRYLAWLIPSLGFIGTVWGILLSLSRAAAFAPDDPALLPAVIGSLSVAFFTTLLALMMSCVLVGLTHVVQAREERALNAACRYCLEHFINRIVVS